MLQFKVQYTPQSLLPLCVPKKGLPPMSSAGAQRNDAAIKIIAGISTKLPLIVNYFYGLEAMQEPFALICLQPCLLLPPMAAGWQILYWAAAWQYNAAAR
jgi:hypothetical protein